MAGYLLPSASGTEANIGSAISAATGQLLNIWAVTASLTPAFINELAFGPSGPPNATDCSIEYIVLNTTTAAPTGGTGAVRADNTGSRAAGTQGTTNATGGDTIGTTFVYSIGLNQRASYRWTAIPGYEIMMAATNLAGLVLGAKSATYASTIGSSLHFFE